MTKKQTKQTNKLNVLTVLFSGVITAIVVVALYKVITFDYNTEYVSGPMCYKDADVEALRDINPDLSESEAFIASKVKQCLK